MFSLTESASLTLTLAVSQRESLLKAVQIWEKETWLSEGKSFAQSLTISDQRL
jgi:hypothetical protein